MTRAVYAGAFDPITKGHEDILQRASAIFDQIIAGVFDTPAKSLLFSTEERLDLLQQTVQHIPNVEVKTYSGLTVEFAADVGATTMIRGLRSITDLDYEVSMVMMNRKLRAGIDTIFLYTNLDFQFVSSTLIKEVARYGGDITNWVPQHVAVALRQKFKTAV
ncbi:MAG: pantetheine-phosphate adenylyltransferase [Dehalococcoidia bacterium]